MITGINRMCKTTPGRFIKWQPRCVWVGSTGFAKSSWAWMTHPYLTPVDFTVENQMLFESCQNSTIRISYTVYWHIGYLSNHSKHDSCFHSLELRELQESLVTGRIYASFFSASFLTFEDDCVALKNSQWSPLVNRASGFSLHVLLAVELLAKGQPWIFRCLCPCFTLRMSSICAPLSPQHARFPWHLFCLFCASRPAGLDFGLDGQYLVRSEHSGSLRGSVISGTDGSFHLPQAAQWMLATVPPVYYIPLLCRLSQSPWASWESLPLSQECLFISSPCSAWRNATSACEPLKAGLYKQEMFSSHSPFLLKSSSINPLAKVIKTMYLINSKSIPKSRAWWAKYFF